MRHVATFLVVVALASFPVARTTTNDAAPLPSDAEILDVLYESTVGGGWDRSFGWSDRSRSVCERYGVRCDDDGRVERVELRSNNLVGEVPSILYSLPRLRELNLGENEQLFVDLRHLRNAALLDSLRLDDTGLRSLRGVGTAVERNALTTLDLSRNDLGGTTIPDALFGLTNLRSLRLDGCDLVGRLDDDDEGYRLRSLTRLEELSLADNRFTGRLPAFSVDMNDLVHLNLSGNDLTGTIPDSFRFLLDLEELLLSGRPNAGGGGGGGLTGPLPSLSELTALRRIDLSDNSLTGTIPLDFLGGVDRNAAAVEADLSDNRLTGTVPVNLASFANLRLDLAGNRLEGPLEPVLCGGGDCDALLCAVGTAAPRGRATADEPCAPCPSDGAAAWLGSRVCADRYGVERDALRALFTATGGREAWKETAGWDEADDVCEWYGVECSDRATGHVWRVELVDNGLRGTIPSEVWTSLPFLYSLDVKDNLDVEVELKGVGKALGLRRLNLDNTGQNMLVGIEEAVGLESLSVRKADLKRTTIPEELWSMNRLESIDLDDNHLEGTLSTRVGSLSRLVRLNLAKNHLTGTIPTEIGRLDALEELDLAANRLRGRIPEELESLTNLRELYLDRQSPEDSDESNVVVVGTFRSGLSGPVPSFADLSVLSVLRLNDNALTGSVPSDLLLHSRLTSDRLLIHLSHNSLVGEVPVELYRFERLNLYLVGNALDHVPARVCRNRGEWMDGRVAAYGCDAILCGHDTSNPTGRRRGDDDPCEDCPDGEGTAHMGATECAPTDEEALRREQYLYLRELYEATRGDGWTRNDGWTTTNDTDVCGWYGVSCEGRTSVRVTSIELPYNQLVGVVPGEVFSLRGLRTLDLSMNDVDVPDSFRELRRARRLRVLNLHSTGLDRVDGLEEARALEELHLENNNFGGRSIPTEIYELTTLKQLYLSESNLAGTIDARIGELTDLVGLYLYGNRLSGRIPEEMGNLAHVEWVALAENRLTGPLPNGLEDLVSLRALSLSEQRIKGGGLSGPLLDFSRSPALTTLYLAGNSLTGPVPADLLKGAEDLRRLVSVDLSDNALTGTLPAALARLRRLRLDVTNNHIESIDDALCDEVDWMDGNVATFRCDAILCPAGTYNSRGRREREDAACDVCDSPYRRDHMGRTECALPPKSEREILGILYQGGGGEGWFEKEGWTDDDAHPCDLHGVECGPDRAVTGVDLAGNNLTGTVDEYLFALPQLARLALGNNPGLNVTFRGLERAKRLRSLSLDSTGLASLKGVGKAGALTELNFRFNRLAGTLPDELFELTDLVFLTGSDNDLTGTLSSAVNDLASLRVLALGSNRLEGPLPSLSRAPRLRRVDLSRNAFAGPVPPDFLAGVDAGANDTVVVDLSDNALTGAFPDVLAGVPSTELSLRDNRIERLHPALCERSGWNRRAVGAYGCDGLACPRGTYHAAGRRVDDATRCERCPSAEYVGSTECEKSRLSHHVLAAMIVAALAGCCLAFVVLKDRGAVPHEYVFTEREWA